MGCDSPDVVVVGGGPAGSTTSTLLAQQGCRVELFERERFPRFHIGESLIPETYWVLRRLNMLPTMQQSHFVKKHSVQFVNSTGEESARFYFWDNKPHECSQTWQVVRHEFDLMMLNNAREHGVCVREGTRVFDVLFEDHRAVGVTVRNEDVVDASGQNGLISNRLRLRVWDPVLNKGAIWTYWEGAYRDTGRDERATLVLQTPDRKGWFWYIPQHDNVISVGVVAPFDLTRASVLLMAATVPGVSESSREQRVEPFECRTSTTNDAFIQKRLETMLLLVALFAGSLAPARAAHTAWHSSTSCTVDPTRAPRPTPDRFHP